MVNKLYSRNYIENSDDILREMYNYYYEMKKNELSPELALLYRVYKASSRNQIYAFIFFCIIICILLKL